MEKREKGLPGELRWRDTGGDRAGRAPVIGAGEEEATAGPGSHALRRSARYEGALAG